MSDENLPVPYAGKPVAKQNSDGRSVIPHRDNTQLPDTTVRQPQSPIQYEGNPSRQNPFGNKQTEKDSTLKRPSRAFKIAAAAIAALTVSAAAIFEYGVHETGLERADLASRMKDRFTEAVGIDYEFTHMVTVNPTPITRESNGLLKGAYEAGDCVTVRYNYDDGQSRIVHMGTSGGYNYSMISQSAISALPEGYECPNNTDDQPRYTSAKKLRSLSLTN